MTLVSYERRGATSWIVMGAEDALTTMTVEIMSELRRGFDKARRDDEVNVIVLTGRGSAFMAGADLNFVQSATASQFKAFSRENQALASEILSCEKPIIAGINGHAIGGGLEVALACDIRVTAAEAKFGLPEVTIGLLHSTASSYTLPQLVGSGRAAELTLTGRLFSAEDAMQYGIVTSVVTRESLTTELTDLATRISNNSTAAMQWAKQLFRSGATSDIASAIALEEIGGLACFDSDERRRNLELYLTKLRSTNQSPHRDNTSQSELPLGGLSRSTPERSESSHHAPSTHREKNHVDH